MNHGVDLLTLCFLFLLFRLLAAEEVDLGVDGQPLKSTLERSVEFVSFYDRVLDLYWTGSTDGRGSTVKVKIVELQKGIRTKVTTFDGHIFHAESRKQEYMQNLERWLSHLLNHTMNLHR